VGIVIVLGPVYYHFDDDIMKNNCEGNC
jgi:hypothetical protein